jgi:hypothetical protein
MDHGIAFESTTDKNAKRREKQEARQQIIDKVIIDTCLEDILLKEIKAVDDLIIVQPA